MASIEYNLPEISFNPSFNPSSKSFISSFLLPTLLYRRLADAQASSNGQGFFPTDLLVHRLLESLSLLLLQKLKRIDRNSVS